MSGKAYRAACSLSATLALCLLATVAITRSASAETIVLPASGIITDIKERALYRPDPTGSLSPKALLETDAGFREQDQSWEESAPPMWVKLRLHNTGSSEKTYRLLVKSRFFNRLDVHLPAGGSGRRVVHSGAKDYDPARKLGHNFVYRFEVPPDSKTDLLLFVDSFQDSLRVLDMSLLDEGSYQDYRTTSYWAFGLYFGAMLALIFYNLILYLNLRTPGHRLYVSAMICVIILMGFNSGLLQNLLPTALDARSPVLLILFNALTAATTSRFAQIFVNTRSYTPRFHRVISLIIGLNLLVAAPALGLPVEFAPRLAAIAQPIGSITMALLLFGSLYAGIRGSSSGYIFFAAWCAFGIGAVTWTLLSFAAIGRTPATEYSLYIGSVMEAMILALGLSYRVGQLRTQRNRAIREQQKAARLANIDPLTGAFNRRFIENYLDGLLNAEDKRAFQGSLIMLDMDKFKPINDEFGHAAGDAVLNEMARRCLETLRSEDVLARLGGDEFAIVLPDQSGKDARAVAERICSLISTKPATFGMQPIPMSVSVGVVTTFEPGATAYSAFKYADHALYEAKRAGRNQVVVYTGGAEPSPKNH